MDIKSIYETAIYKWPGELSLFGAELIPEVDGFYCPELSKFWNDIEESSSNDYENLMHWVLFKIIHRHAKEAFINKYNVITLDKIDFNDVENEFRIAFKKGGYV